MLLHLGTHTGEQLNLEIPKYSTFSTMSGCPEACWQQQTQHCSQHMTLFAASSVRPPSRASQPARLAAHDTS